MNAGARVVCTAALLALSLAAAPAALAEEVDEATFRDLAAGAAAGDAVALDLLLDVDSVAGFEVDIAALVGPDDAGRPARLQTLAAGTARTVDADAARAVATAILSERPYAGDLVAPGDRSIMTRIFDALGDIAGRLFFGAEGSTALFFLTAAAVLAAAVLLGGYLTRRRAVERTRRRREQASDAAPERPTDLENAAARAEGAGDYAGAIRLRFRAGLLRLDQRGIVPFDPSMTTGRLHRALRTVESSHVARVFDEVVYGGRPATARDADDTRSGWMAILARRPQA